MKIKLSWKLWVWLIALIFSLIAIFGIPPAFMQKGVLVSSVDPNSTAFEQGLRQNQIITAIDGHPVRSVEDFSRILAAKFPSNESVKTIIQTTDSKIFLYSSTPPEITVQEVPKSNIKMGLDLVGGARALVQAKDKKLSSSEVNDLVEVISNRLNVYGIEDVTVVPALDLEGNNRIRVEIAGATPEDLEKLIGEQGKFEAKIGNKTVFVGGNKDIASVGRDAQHARIESCSPFEEGYVCRFSFTVVLSPEAAKRHAEITQNLSVNSTPEGNFLSEKLDLYVDDNLVDSLLISEDLKGRVTTQIAISGSGKGPTQADAYNDAVASMHRLQTILITGSLPYKLEIVKLDTISPTLGRDFIKFILIAAITALVLASLVVFVRYHNFKSSLMVILFSFSEIVIILGVAALIQWNLDLASIAGILATIGTGFDDQIVILDESKNKRTLSLKQRFKRAFAIIMGAYFTSVVSLLPLIWAGAGLLKGFAITTIIGISVGVFITRPAFADVIKKMEVY